VQNTIKWVTLTNYHSGEETCIEWHCKYQETTKERRYDRIVW